MQAEQDMKFDPLEGANMSDNQQNPKNQHTQNEDTGKLTGLAAGALSGAILGQANLSPSPALVPLPAQ
ncbi:MAG: hypothetical protein HC828_15210 [Blastochloris sp.]|nr:hypothetical protein [Blastochloris sp.]